MKNIIGPLQAQLKLWWRSITPREQRLVLIGGICIVIGVIYWGILAPLQQRIDQSQLRINSEKQLLSWVSHKANQITALRKQGGMTQQRLPLNQVIATSTRDFGIELIRVQPRDEDGMQVWIQPLPFTKLLDWVKFLQENQGITVQHLDVDRGDQPGVVEVKRLQLKRGA
ncbi:type II secretion system protein M [Vibrio sp. CAIM 722]|uniref:Type II secretion system protein M n=1 Tax=Vibrio eleionomae TaxID=2653505 RepID=A0A7X4LMZ2_9VIBR|nr:type II secretion system protein M [Vibrio eleionomae]MZI94760.1 type II secretion system protein M [Vibrio eleionomae]